MSEPATSTTPPPPATTTDERLWPGIVYGLYLLQFFTGFTALVGVIAAYVLRDRASDMARSHYDFLISTFWWSIPPVILTIMLLIIGVPLSFILVGIPIMIFAAMLGTLWAFWYVLRCVVGAVRLARSEAYPHPGAIIV